jgi:hypothetical protein
MTDDELDTRLREAVCAEAIDTASLERAIRAQIRWPHAAWYVAAATVAAATVAALVLLSFFANRVPAGFRDAARDHRLEVVERRPRRWQPTAWEGEPAVPAHYRLEHSKICRIEDHAVMHLVYTDGSHEVSVYIGTAASGDADVGGQHVTSFRTARMSGLVVGSVSECRQFAAVIQRLT